MSSDIVKPPAKKRVWGKQKKRKKGGQKGHKRQMREMLPPERVDETFEYDMDEDEVRWLGLTATNEFEVVQNIELRESPIHVTEHRLRVYLTPDGKRTTASVPVSRGYLSKLCTGVISDSLAEVYDELKEAIPHQKQLGSDETGFKNNGKKHWVWAICSKDLTLFHIAKSRGSKVLDELIGPDFQGFFNADYFSANCSFAWHNDILSQFCWAHLIRDIRFLLTHSSRQVTHWAERLLKQTKRLFRSWHARGELQPYDRSEDYFRFISSPNLLEPTNNHCEQQIRHCVIDRRITQGTRSDVGQRYNERMWSIVATCAKQGRRIFDFLHDSISAHLANKPTPSLLG